MVERTDAPIGRIEPRELVNNATQHQLCDNASYTVALRIAEPLAFNRYDI